MYKNVQNCIKKETFKAQTLEKLLDFPTFHSRFFIFFSLYKIFYNALQMQKRKEERKKKAQHKNGERS
jgi:hypothetical protein